MREKMIELLKEADRYEFEEQKKSGTYSVEAGWKLIADNLIANDVVPVVRCKDCKYWNKDALHCNALPFETTSEHENWYEYDFCSYGERKDNEEH